MSANKALEIAALAAGVPTRVPQLIVHQAASQLRRLLDSGVPPTDPRVQSLLQLVNQARLILLPTSNDAARTAPDLVSSAVHIDVSTATMAAIMGLNNAHTLRGAAVAEANAYLAAKPASQPPGPQTPTLKLSLKPKLARKATDALLQLITTDSELGERAHNDVHAKNSVMAQKIQRMKASTRHANLRRRRMSADAQSSDITLRASNLHHPPASGYTSSHPPSLAPYHQIPTVPTAVNRSFTPTVSFLKPPAGPSIHRPPSHPSTSIDLHSFDPLNPSYRRPLSTAQFSRYRKPIILKERPEKHIANDAIVSQKGVMNDTMCTPEHVMEAFLYPPASRIQQVQHENFDNQTKIRSVLTERERVILRLLRRRRAELAAMPLDMTEQTRRNAIIEAKQLSLLEMQRVVRNRVCTEMKKMYSLAIQEDGFVPPDHLSRLFRRRDPPIYSYTDGYPRITPFDTVPEMPPRHPETIAKDSIRMAEFDKSRMEALKSQRKNDLQAKLLVHYNNFKNAVSEGKSARARIWKNFERYLIEKKRAEERRRKLERIERLRLLRSNDEQAYLKLLKNTKNERLLQLVRQTDSYLMRIGAQVEREREKVEESMGMYNTFNEELRENDTVPIDAMRRRRDLYYTVTHSVQEEVRQPSIMVHGTLKAYQLEGLKWMVSLYNNNLNGILADEMGLGKTIQTISLVTYLVEMKKNHGPFLIIVPLSTMGNWVRELDLWAPSLNKIVYRGDKSTRKNIQQTQMANGDYNVVLTTYEFTVKDQHVLSPIYWQYIVIDEGHRMKNANCKLAMTLGVKYKSRNRLLLTGTPLQNNLTELWALLNFLLPTIFASADTFETWFKKPFETALGDSAELEEEETLLVINRLHQVLRPFLLRRLKTDVESQLPQKVEHVLHCAMSSWQKVIYRQVMNRIGLATGKSNGVRAFNNLLMQCKKVCNHPYLFYDYESIASLPQDYLVRASGKFHLLHHMLPKLRLHGHRTLIFSQMTAALDYLEYFLGVIGVHYLRLDGTTKADDRQALLNKFNAKDSPYFCFLLSTRAGGLGLNLQTADTVIIFDSDWNPMMDLQAQDRAHRIGQTKVVRVFRLICPSTIEEKILEQANRKLQVDAQIIQAGQFNNKSTEMDRHQMLKGILRQRNEDDGTASIPTMEELNRLFAQDDDEYDEFVKYDQDIASNGYFKPIFAEERELPDWVLQPEIDQKTAEEKEQEILLSHGRGRRKRKVMHDIDSLTEAEWLKVMEGEATMEEVFRKRKKRRESRQSESKKSESEEGKNSYENGTDNQKPGTRKRIKPTNSSDSRLGSVPCSSTSKDTNSEKPNGSYPGSTNGPNSSFDLRNEGQNKSAEYELGVEGSVGAIEQTIGNRITESDGEQLLADKKSKMKHETVVPVYVKLRIRTPCSDTNMRPDEDNNRRQGSSTRKRRRSQKVIEMANGTEAELYKRHKKKQKTSSLADSRSSVDVIEGKGYSKQSSPANLPGRVRKVRVYNSGSSSDNERSELMKEATPEVMGKAPHSSGYRQSVFSTKTAGRSDLKNSSQGKGARQWEESEGSTKRGKPLENSGGWKRSRNTREIPNGKFPGRQRGNGKQSILLRLRIRPPSSIEH
ncbi:Transcription regulatory protein SNF2 [Gracilariopsis chorda]|uniref:Transcription regulatory protein SNF2 n=1 Tax=Gracilariopsis chorda TaxID=448386 RepID=A0A2V3J6R6_9FLOR|nr:Transcription regulatory protein SNF2 [Gracilariopsis chorda]|eukprot:PXF50064.1 Transcription regulatory protein SNF2 [Gracilariopsis chorda]